MISRPSECCSIAHLINKQASEGLTEFDIWCRELPKSLIFFEKPQSEWGQILALTLWTSRQHKESALTMMGGVSSSSWR